MLGDNNENNSLKFGNRKERSVLITTVATAIIVILNNLFSAFGKQFNTICTNNLCVFGNCPFNGMHFTIPLCITSLLFILTQIFVYIYFELKGLSTGVDNEKNAHRANVLYKNLFDIVIFHFLFVLILFVILSILFSPNSLVTVILFTIVMVSFGCIVFIKWIKKIKIPLKNIGLYLIGYIVIYGLLILMGISQISSNYGDVNVNYSEAIDLPVHITVSGYCGKPTINYTIENDTNRAYSIQSSEIKTSFTEVANKNAYTEQKGHYEVQTNKKNNKYMFDTTIYLKDKLKNGNNTVCFVINISNKEVKVVNEIYMDNKSASIVQKNLSCTF